MRRWRLAGAFGALMAALPVASALAATPVVASSGAVVFLPGPEAERFVLESDGAMGVGVFPDSRDSSAFWSAVSAGGPVETAGTSSPLGGIPCALPDLFGAELSAEQSPPPPDGGPRDAADLVFCDRVVSSSSTRLQVFVVDSALQARAALQGSGSVADGAPIMVLGSGDRTPLVVGLVGWNASRRGVLTGGIARRPGVVTPYDITATIADIAGLELPTKGFIGRSLHVVPDDDPSKTTVALAERLERDCCFGAGISAATITLLAGFGVVLTALLLLAGWTGLALRSARAAAAGVLGYVASLFVPSGNAILRSIPLVIAYLIGFAVPRSDAAATRRQIGKLLGLGALSIGILTVLAALRPGGEPALSLWADPLVSWRLFGLRNHLTSMLQLGVMSAIVVGMKKPDIRLHVLVAVAGVVVVGAPVLGANFVAVLTLTFGAAMTAVVLLRKSVKVPGVLISGLIALVAFGLALLSDAGSPVSHGGQAVQRVRVGGLDAAYDFVSVRLRLNFHQIRDLWGGFAWTAGLVIGLVWIFVWATRDDRLPIAVRAAMAGGAAAAFAALLAEDTGFLAGGTMALAPWLVAVTAMVERKEIASRQRVRDGAG